MNTAMSGRRKITALILGLSGIVAGFVTGRQAGLMWVWLIVVALVLVGMPGEKEEEIRQKEKERARNSPTWGTKIQSVAISSLIVITGLVVCTFICTDEIRVLVVMGGIMTGVIIWRSERRSTTETKSTLEKTRELLTKSLIQSRSHYPVVI